jgi:hypothetical protein
MRITDLDDIRVGDTVINLGCNNLRIGGRYKIIEVIENDILLDTHGDEPNMTGTWWVNKVLVDIFGDRI